MALGNRQRVDLAGEIYSPAVSQVANRALLVTCARNGHKLLGFDLQAAFVNFGRQRHGFLPFSDIQSDYYQIPHDDKSKLKNEEENLRLKLKEESKNIENTEKSPEESSELNILTEPQNKISLLLSLVSSEDFQLFKAFLAMCSECKILLKPSKVKIGFTQVQFYGTNVGHKVISPAERNLDPIKKMTIMSDF